MDAPVKSPRNREKGWARRSWTLRQKVRETEKGRAVRSWTLRQKVSETGKRLGYEIADTPAKSPRNRTMETFSEKAKLETDGESVEKRHASAFRQGVIRLDRPLFSRFFLFPACFFRGDCYIIFSFRHGTPSILPDGVMVAQVILVHLV